MAILVEQDKDAELEDRLNALARDWAGRADIRLLGPMAPYDFVTTTQT